MTQIVIIYLLGAVSIAIGAGVIAGRRRIAAFNEAAINRNFSSGLSARSAASSTPATFLMIGIGAIVVGMIVLLFGVLASVGVLHVHH